MRDVRFVSDGAVHSSAGVTAGIDASFRNLTEYAGEEVAQRSARSLGFRIDEPESPAPVFTRDDASLYLLYAGFCWTPRGLAQAERAEGGWP